MRGTCAATVAATAIVTMPRSTMLKYIVRHTRNVVSNASYATDATRFAANAEITRPPTTPSDQHQHQQHQQQQARRGRTMGTHPSDFGIPKPPTPPFLLAGKLLNPESFTDKERYLWPQMDPIVLDVFGTRGTMFDDNLYRMAVTGRNHLHSMVRPVTTLLADHADNKKSPHIIIDGPPGAGKTVLQYQLVTKLLMEHRPVLWLSNVKVLLDGKEMFERDPKTGLLLQYAYVLRVLRRMNNLNKGLFPTIKYKDTDLASYINTIAPSTAPPVISQIEDIDKLRSLHEEFEAIVKMLDARGDFVILMDEINALYTYSRYPTPTTGFHTPSDFWLGKFFLSCLSKQKETIPKTTIISAPNRTDVSTYSACLHEKIQSLEDCSAPSSLPKVNVQVDMESPVENSIDLSLKPSLLGTFDPESTLDFTEGTRKFMVPYFDYYELASFLSFLRSHEFMFKDVTRSMIASMHALTGGNPIEIMQNVHDPRIR